MEEDLLYSKTCFFVRVDGMEGRMMRGRETEDGDDSMAVRW